MDMNNTGGTGMRTQPTRQRRYGETGKAGWYFWFPFLMGAMFLVIGVVTFVGGAAIQAASGLLGAAVINLILGVGFMLWAFYAWHDIRRVEPEAPLPGSISEQTATELVTTGIPARATVKGFKYVAGSSAEGTTLVELELDVTTGRGATLPIVHRSRMPLKLTDRLAAGATVPVRVSATEPSKLMVEWAGLVPARGA